MGGLINLFGDDDTDLTDWHVVNESPMCRTWHRFRVDADGSINIDVREETLNIEALRAVNREDQANTAGKTWGDGQIIGRLPDHLLHSTGYAEARKARDEKWIRRFWNDSDHRDLRVKTGRV